MKLCVYAIAKNESMHVERWYDGVRDADEVVVLDTGSTDDTVAKLESLGVRVATTTFDNFRFDTARNASLTMVGSDMDYAMFVDLDEVLAPGSIATIKQHLQSDKDMYTVDLIFTRTDDGVPEVWYKREAIHKAQKFRWKYPVHELLYPVSGSYNCAHIPVEVDHIPDKNKTRGSYINLLEVAVQENPDNPRCIQYLGREYFYEGRWLDAIMWLKRHITVEAHGPFRSESAIYIAQCYRAMENSLESALDEAEAWCLRAISEYNSAREPYCELAALYFDCGAYECAIGMARSALRILEQPDVNMIHIASYYKGWPHHILAASYFNLGQVDKAKEEIQLALSFAGGKIEASLLADVTQILGDITHVDKPIERERD